MPVNRRNIPSNDTPRKRRRPATTPEARESQLIAKAERLAERQLEDGTASAQVIAHFLKLGSSREKLEKRRLEGEVELQKAKIEAMASTQKLEQLYLEAMSAMRGYQGKSSEEPEDDPDLY